MQFTDADLPYPDPTDPMSAMPSLVQSLAEGIAAPTTLSLVAAAGWTLDAQRCWRLLGSAFVWFDVEATRTGAVLTMPADGNIGNTDVLTLADVGEHPPRDSQLHGARAGSSHFLCRVTTGGLISLDAGYPNATIPTSGKLLIYGLVPYI